MNDDNGINRSIKEPTSPLMKLVSRFGVVGIANTILTFLLYSILVVFGVGYQISLIITGTTGILLSSLLNKSYTFKRRGRLHSVIFICVYVLTVGLNLILLDYGVNDLNSEPIIVQATLVLPIAGLTFSLLWLADRYLVASRNFK